MRARSHDDVEHEAERLSRSPSRYALTARAVGRWSGSATAFGAVWIGLAVWTGVGVGVGFPRWWEVVVTVGFPFITLGLLTVLQHTQNHDTNAIALKLDELIENVEGASSALVRIEDASEEDLERLQRVYTDRLG